MWSNPVCHGAASRRRVEGWKSRRWQQHRRLFNGEQPQGKSQSFAVATPNDGCVERLWGSEVGSSLVPGGVGVTGFDRSREPTTARGCFSPSSGSFVSFYCFFLFFSFPCFLCFYFPPSLVCSGTGKCGRRRVFFDVERDECVISVVGEGKSPNRRLAEGKCDRDRGGEESRSERRRGVVPCSRRRRMQKSRTGV